VGSRYTLERRINAGSMGEVWRGLDATGAPVAVKLMHERFANDPTMLARFVRERTVLIGLRHPNLVAMHDMIIEGSRLALVMDLVEGADLQHRLEERGPFAPGLAVTLIAQVCDALAVVHAAGIVHRDLKPGNILMDQGQAAPAARLTDFGIAWAQDHLSLATSEGVAVGTPAYTAPEVITGQRGGPPSDIYAAGICLFEMLTGRRLFGGGDSTATVMWRQVRAEPLRPPTIAPELWRVISACLAKDPATRPDAAATARLLRQCLPGLRGLPAPAPLPDDVPVFAMTESPARSGRGGPPRSWPALGGRRRRATLALAALAALAACVAAVIGFALARPHNGAPAGRTAFHLSTPRASATLSSAAPSPSAPARSHHPARRRRAQRHRSGRRRLHRSPGPPASPTPKPSPSPPVSRMLYTFQNGGTDGWQAGTNVASISAVRHFADGPKHPYQATYALDGAPGSYGSVIPDPRSMTVQPAVPLNLSAARTFFLHVDGFGYPPYATGYQVRVTLTSGSHTLTSTMGARCNTWNPISVRISYWPYRGRITAISVSWIGIGSKTTPWWPHFQIDDVGYRT
jgi:serine/threonine-protein kinase